RDRRRRATDPTAPNGRRPAHDARASRRGRRQLSHCIETGHRHDRHCEAAPPRPRRGSRLSEPIRILITDDHPLFRGGLSALLESVPDTEVVGEATNGHEAVELARTLTPDVVVMDLNMPDLNGIEATRQIVQETTGIRVLVMTMHEDDESVFAALR